MLELTGNLAWCLFETTGTMARELERVGWSVVCFDLQNDNRTEGRVFYSRQDMDAFRPDEWGTPSLIFSFAPCTDLASSGARWWKDKAAANPEFQSDAVRRARIAESMGNKFGCPWALENPVGALSRLWRRPEVYFHPYEFGGYCEGKHPIFPSYFPPRDAYTKKTGIWHGNGFVFPSAKAVEPVPGSHIHHVPPGPLRNKIRSCTPRGFARAVALSNRPPSM